MKGGIQMDIQFCVTLCPISPNIDCRLDAKREIPLFYKENNFDEIVQEIKQKVTLLKNFILQLANFQCLDGGYSAKYDICINNVVVSEVKFSHPNICLPYCGIYFLNELIFAIEESGFSALYDTILLPSSTVLFNR